MKLLPLQGAVHGSANSQGYYGAPDTAQVFFKDGLNQLGGFDPVALGQPAGQAPVQEPDPKATRRGIFDGQNIAGMRIAMEQARLTPGKKRPAN